MISLRQTIWEVPLMFLSDVILNARFVYGIVRPISENESRGI